MTVPSEDPADLRPEGDVAEQHESAWPEPDDDDLVPDEQRIVPIPETDDDED